ncbi:hypothetical protein CYY_009241 [Polysphondylium violaceum]|uniref:GATA-type domain-containing protein n=1 Tax=Polysphondylium violaceum TaxID=133409 RepID=A0A8J4PM11_9MYCE|nr:hypothetical protein CYY_009241 [Polysphondylium violaceum]
MDPKRVYSIGGTPPLPFSAPSSSSNTSPVVISNSANSSVGNSPIITSTPTSPTIVSTTSTTISTNPTIISPTTSFKSSHSSPTLVSTNFENNLTGSTPGMISSGAGSTLPQILTPHKLPGNTATYQTNNGTIVYTVVSSQPSNTTQITQSSIPNGTITATPITTTTPATTQPQPLQVTSTSSSSYRPSYIAGNEAKISPKVKVEDLGPSFMYSQPIQSKPITTSFQNLEQQIDNMSNTSTVVMTPQQQQQQQHQPQPQPQTPTQPQPQQPVNRSTPTIIKQVPNENNNNNNNNCKNNLNNQQSPQYIVLPPDYSPKIKRRKSVENLENNNSNNNVNNNNSNNNNNQFYGYVSYTSSSSTNSKQNSPHSSPNTSPQYFEYCDSSPSSPDVNFKNITNEKHQPTQPMIIDTPSSSTTTTTTTSTSPTNATTSVGFTFPSNKNNATTTFGVMPNEQETWIEIRDLSSGISKMAKSSLTNGITEEMLTEIKEKGLVLMNMIETVTKKEKLERQLNDDDRGRIFPPLTRPRRFRKKKKMALEPANPNNLEKIKKKTDTLFCTSCGTTQTPEWRKGPAGGKSLCNACGLHYAKLMKKEGQLKVETTSSPPSTSMNVIMDQLFRFIFFKHVYLRRQIFDSVVNDVNCKTTNYKNCSNVNWMITNQYIDLLRCKLKYKEHLSMSLEKKFKDIATLKDIDIFTQVFQRFQEILHTDKDYIIGWCAERDNWKAVDFLFEQGYEYPDYLLLEYAYKTRNYKMTQRLFKKTEQVSKQTYIHAINSKDIKFVKLIFDHGRDSFGKESINFREEILWRSMEDGSLEIFKFVKKRFKETHSFVYLRKNFIYSKSLRSRLYLACVNSFETYIYTYNQYHEFFIKHQGSQSDSHYPPVVAARLGVRPVIEHMLENNLIPNHLVDQVIMSANGLELYTRLKNHFKLPLLPLNSICTLFQDLDETKNLVENVGAEITSKDLIETLPHSLEIFKYLFGKAGHALINQVQTLRYSLLLQATLLKDNDQVLHYLVVEQGIMVKPNDGILLWYDLVTSFPNNCFRKIQILLSRAPIFESELYMRVLECASEKCNNFKVFKLLLDTWLPLIQKKGKYLLPLFSNCLLAAVKNGRLATLKYLFQQGLFNASDFPLFLKAATLNGNLTMVKFLIENAPSSPLSIHHSVLDVAIDQNHHHLVKYLTPFFSLESSTSLQN